MQRSLVSLAAACVAVAFASPPLAAQTLSDPGFRTLVDKVEHLPPDAGWIGDRKSAAKQAEGSADDTAGSKIGFTMIYGVQVKDCPDAEGIAVGKGIYDLQFDRLIVDRDVVTKERWSQHADGRMKARVSDDLRVDDVELELDFTSTVSKEVTTDKVDVDITPPSQSSARLTTHFTIDRNGTFGDIGPIVVTRASGEPNITAAFGLMVLEAPQSYVAAISHWAQNDACVHIDFDPPTDTLLLAPKERITINAQLKTKTNPTAVAAKFSEIHAPADAEVFPLSGETLAGATLRLTFEAPDRSEGTTTFSAVAKSHSGATQQEWQAELGYRRLVVTQQIGGNVWQWRHCGSGVGPWVGTSTGLNVGKGTGAINEDGSGWFEYEWTSYGTIPVDFKESGGLLFQKQKGADGKSRYVLQTSTREATGYWKMPRPIGKRPIEAGTTPSPQGAFFAVAEKLNKPCDPKKP